METCTADELFVQDTVLYREFASHFRGSTVIGGQAGIAAAQLASAGAPEVVCIAPSMGAVTQGMLRDTGVTVTGPATVSAGSPDTVHLVFEHSPGLVPLAYGTVPRNNRFIVSPLHDPRTILLDGEMAGKFLEAASTCNRAFLSGYQYLTSDEECRIAADQLRMAKAQNPFLRIHAEWVTVADNAITGRFIRYILPCVDSLGLNERELGFLHHSLGQPVHGGQAPLSAGSLARQATAICRAAGLVRLHLHTFGYYVVIFRDPHDPERTRNALLFAARTVAQASPGEEPVIVPGGYQALEDAAGAFGRELSPGIFRNGEYHVIVIPSLIARGVTRTAGMGDRISSLAFAADPF
jgi:ADP-dependent phosphofructokinase/glucokinase